MPSTDGQLQTPQMSGAVCDNVTDDSAAVTTALAAAGPLGRLLVSETSWLASGPLANPCDADFDGPGWLRYSPSSVLGNRIQNLVGRDGPAWGGEYLYQWRAKLEAGTPSTVRGTGDSTFSQAVSCFNQLQAQLQNFTSITWQNAGESGKSTQDWLATYLAADIAAASDLLIWGYGGNDVPPITLAEFRTALYAGLTAYRAAVPISAGGIMLLGINAMSDGENGRDEYRGVQMNRIIRAAAIYFGCAFVDRLALYPDGYVGTDGRWLDNTYGDGLRGVHPQTVGGFSQSLAGEIRKVLISDGLLRQLEGPGVPNVSGNVVELSASALPSAYPRGLSLWRALTTKGWPLDGNILVLFAQDGSSPMQINWAYEGASSMVMLRTFDYATGAWNRWAVIGSLAPCTVAQLPSAASVGDGVRGFVTDATSAVFMAMPVGSGTSKVPVVTAGGVWVIG